MRSTAMLLALLLSPLHAQEARKPVEHADAPAPDGGLGRPSQALLNYADALRQRVPEVDEREKLAKELGLVLKEGVPGSEEGHVLSEIHYWIGWQDYDLAEAAYRISGRPLNSPSLRFVRSWNLLRWAVAKKNGFARAVTAFEEIQTSDPLLRAHVAALVKSLRDAMPCVHCDGKGRIRCTQCHGKGVVGGVADGIEKTPCASCEQGELKCTQCAGPRSAPALEDICKAARCTACEGRGLAFKTVRWTCGECRGLGQKLIPKADPRKILP